MKRLTLLIICFILQTYIMGQYVIINDSLEGGNSIPFQDTTFWLYTTSNIDNFIDLDQDSIHDVLFEVSLEIGSSTGIKAYTSISTFNDFSVHVDTNYLSFTYYILPDTIIVADSFTRTVVQKYSTGDTIYNNHISTSANTYLTYYEYNEFLGPPTEYGFVNHFFGDTSYIAFTKNTGQSEYLYYIGIYVSHEVHFHLINAKSNEVIITRINEKNTSLNIIYPNPVSEKIYFERSFSSYEIYTFQGILIQSGRINENQRVIEVSGIPKGYYILKFRDNSTEFTTKFIKS